MASFTTCTCHNCAAPGGLSVWSTAGLLAIATRYARFCHSCGNFSSVGLTVSSCALTARVHPGICSIPFQSAQRCGKFCHSQHGTWPPWPHSQTTQRGSGTRLGIYMYVDPSGTARHVQYSHVIQCAYKCEWRGSLCTGLHSLCSSSSTSPNSVSWQSFVRALHDTEHTK